jgi:hypothetical protein
MVTLQHSGRKVFMGEIINAYNQDIAQDLLFGNIGLTSSATIAEQVATWSTLVTGTYEIV